MSGIGYTGSSCSGLSDNSESSLEETPPPPLSAQSHRGNNICRDFMRNVCKRGNQCRYRHVAPGGTGTGGVSMNSGRRQSGELVFCHDFQNAGCQRPACRFIHCTRDQEEAWKQTGIMPTCVTESSLINNETSSVDVRGGDDSAVSNISSGDGYPPVCMDFMNGSCKRGVKCKYRHLSLADYDSALNQGELRRAAVEAALIFEETGAMKKRKIAAEGVIVGGGVQYYESAGEGREEYFEYHTLPPRPPPTQVVSLTDYQILEEENRFLRHKVDDLKRHIDILSATNELLLEQNARYRNTTTTVMVPPIVAVSQVPTPTITPAVRHHAGPHGITTMATLGHVAINGQLMQPCPTALVHPSNVGITGASAGSVIDPSATVSMTIVPMTIPVDGSIGAQNMATITRPSLVSMVDVPNVDLNMAMSLPNLVISGANMCMASTCGAPNMASIGASNMASLSSDGQNREPMMSIAHMAYCGGSSNMRQPMSISALGRQNMVQSLNAPHMSSVSMPQPPPILNLPQTNANLIQLSYPVMSHSQLPSSSLV